jgi:hypothetical protein
LSRPAAAATTLVGFLLENAVSRYLWWALSPGGQCHCGRGGHFSMLITFSRKQCLDIVLLLRLQVYMSSSGLDSDAIVSFVRCLVAISLDELRDVAAPRVFSLTKIVEISHFNMGRIR